MTCRARSGFWGTLASGTFAGSTAFFGFGAAAAAFISWPMTNFRPHVGQVPFSPTASSGAVSSRPHLHLTVMSIATAAGYQKETRESSVSATPALACCELLRVAGELARRARAWNGEQGSPATQSN